MFKECPDVEAMVDKWGQLESKIREAAQHDAKQVQNKKDTQQLEVGMKVKFLLFRRPHDRSKLCLPMRGPAEIVKLSRSHGACVLKWKDPVTGKGHVLDRNARDVRPWTGGTRGLENIPAEETREVERPMTENQDAIFKRVWRIKVPTKKSGRGQTRSGYAYEVKVPPLFLIRLVDGKVHEFQEHEVREELLYGDQRKVVDVGFPKTSSPGYATCKKHLEGYKGHFLDDQRSQ